MNNNRRQTQQQRMFENKENTRIYVKLVDTTAYSHISLQTLILVDFWNARTRLWATVMDSKLMVVAALRNALDTFVL
jgi:hypothetical protein